MKNTDFYAYCREQRKTETDPNKKQVLTEVYNYLNLDSFAGGIYG